MRTSVRAIVVKDDQLLLMHRNKHGQQYYALIGGGVDPGETLEAALARELEEEASMAVANPRLVIIEDSKRFGKQYIYYCDYAGGEPVLGIDSEEAEQHQNGNLYTPLWLPLTELETAELMPPELKPILLEGLKNGFSPTPIELTLPE